MIRVKAEGVSPIPLGRQGERDVTQVVFDLTPYIRSFGEGEAQLTVRRAGDPKEYAAALEQDGSTAVWTVGAEWTASDGSGFCQLSWYVGERLAKSVTYKTRVQEAMGMSDENAPEPQAGYLAQVQAAGAQAVAADKHVTQVATEVTEAAQRAEQAAADAQGYTSHPPVIGENGNWWEWDGEVYVDTGKPSRGEQGPQGIQGERGPSGYVLTQEDKQDIVTAVLEALPAAEEVAY